MSLTILLADDHQIVRQGLHALLKTEPDFELVGEAADGLETIRLIGRLKPNVLVLDLMMPGMNGLEITRQVSQRFPQTRVVILSMHSNEAYVVEAVQAGAHAYVLKESTAAELVQAIRQAAAGKRFVSGTISERSLEAYSEKMKAAPLEPYQTLTQREREVLQLAAEGHSSADIARRLYIGTRTVESHRANLMRKLNVRNQTELVHFAIRRGIVPLPG